MSRDGVYSPIKPMDNEERDFGVKVTDRYELGQHSTNFYQGPVTSIIRSEGDEEMWLHGWSPEPRADDTYMYSCHHSWSMSKLYHTYSDGSNFEEFWTRASEYCRPFRLLYVVRHGGEFQNLAEIAYGSYENELFEVLCDGKGGYLLIRRGLGEIKSLKDVEVVENHNFCREIEKSVQTI